MKTRYLVILASLSFWITVLVSQRHHLPQLRDAILHDPGSRVVLAATWIVCILFAMLIGKLFQTK